MGKPGNRGDRVFHALIGDMAASKEIEDRSGVQRRLIRLLGTLNDELAPSLAVPLKVTSGDEIQGLFLDPTAVVAVLSRMAEELYPVHFAWGLGAGEVSTDLADDVAMVDGPCLHRARAALDEAKQDGGWLRTKGLPAPHGDVLAALLNLAGAIRSGWTATQVEYIRAARHHTQREVAEASGVNESTVSRGLGRAHFRAVLEGESAARELLASLGGDREGG